MSSTTTLDMSPGAVVNSAGNYCLQQDDMYNLLKYMWAGALLPLSPPTYQMRLQISTEAMAQYASLINDLLAVYTTVSGHCNTFRTTTYPAIVDIAADVYSYAQNAGGTVQDSFYANIFQAIRDFSTATTQEEQSTLTQKIDELVGAQLTAISGIVAKGQSAVADLTTFQQQCIQDQTDLKSQQTAVEDAITSETGSLDTLKQKLQDDRTTLAADQAEYEHDKIVACTTLTYAWVPFWGVIAATVVAGIYGHAAAVMASDIDTLKADITSESGQVTDDTRVIADLTSVSTDLDNLVAAIQPAITTIELMLGAWSAISGDLTNLQTMVKTDVSTADAAIGSIVDQKLVDKWNTLATAVQNYQQAAFLTQPEQLTIDQLSAQLQEQAQQTVVV